MANADSIENVVRRAARESGMSMLELSKRTGLGYQTVYGFCSQSRGITLESAGKLCELLGLELRPVKRRKRR
jgi:transcriptional regulator with XRE-family HTH domain